MGVLLKHCITHNLMLCSVCTNQEIPIRPDLNPSGV